MSREVGKVEARLRHYLYPHVDQKLLSNIENARVSREYFKIIHKAIEHCVIHDDVVIANLDKVSNPDIVAEVADLLMRLRKNRLGLQLRRLQRRYPHFSASDRPLQRCRFARFEMRSAIWVRLAVTK